MWIIKWNKSCILFRNHLHTCTKADTVMGSFDLLTSQYQRSGGLHHYKKQRCYVWCSDKWGFQHGFISGQTDGGKRWRKISDNFLLLSNEQQTWTLKWLVKCILRLELFSWILWGFRLYKISPKWGARAKQNWAYLSQLEANSNYSNHCCIWWLAWTWWCFITIVLWSVWEQFLGLFRFNYFLWNRIWLK